MTGYVRKDTSNNIADGNIINSADLDAEFDGVVDAFNASTGHKHDGSTGEGAPITVVGPTQDVTVSATAVTPKTTNTVDLGSSSLKFKDIFIAGSATLPTVNATTVDTTNVEVTNIKAKDGTASATIADTTGVMTIASSILTTADINGGTIDGTTIGGTTAAAGAFTTLSTTGALTYGGVTLSNAVTGTGNMVLSNSPTLTTPNLGTPSAIVLTNASGTASININGTVGATTPNTGAFTTLTTSSTVTHNGGTANGVAYLNGSKVLTTGSALTFDGTNFGIGTASPNAKLVVAGGSEYITNTAGNAAGIEIAGNGNTPTTTSLFIGQGSTSLGFIYQRANADLAFGINNSEQMRLTSTGLGIGTSSPGYKLDVSGGDIRVTSSSAPSVLVNNTSASGKNYRLISADSGNFIIQNTGVADLVYLNTSGNLGLGVTPSAWNNDYRSVAISNFAEFYGRVATPAVGVAYNAFRNGGGSWIYKTTNAAARYEQDSGFHIWSTAPSGTAGNAISFTQAMTLDASGNLGVGTTSPQGRLHVRASTATAFFQCDDTGQVQLNFGGTTNAVKGGIYYSDNADVMWFRTGSTERARIDSSGNLLVGTTSAPTGTSGGSGFITESYSRKTLKLATSTTLGVGLVEFINPNGSVGFISTSGSSTIYNTSSDYRLKENIAPMTGALDKVATLKPCTYKWKTDGSDGEGFIAHELQEVVPQCVTGEKDAVDAEGKPVYQGIDTSFLVATLTAAIQEQQAIIEQLRADVAALKGAA